MNIQKASMHILITILLIIASTSFASSSSSSSNNFNALIQAEDYTNMSGVQNETSDDAGGGLKVSSIESGDWISYYGIGVNIPVSGSYKLTYRIKGNGAFKFKESSQTGNTIYATVSIPAGADQVWTNVTSNISLTAGVHHFGITAHAGLFSLNWFKIESTTSTSTSSSSVSSSYSSTQSSSSSSASSLSSKPASITDLTVGSLSANGAILHWTNNGNPVKVYRKNVTLSGSFAVVASGVSGSSYANNSLTPGNTYQWYITSSNAFGQSPTSNIVSGTTSLANATLISRLDASTVAIDGSHSGVGWGFGAQDGATLERVSEGGKTWLKGNYPIDSSSDKSGANYIYGGFTFPNLKQDLYVTVYAKMPGYTNGLKFCKFFSANSGQGYANATFGGQTDSEPLKGALEYAAYGDGSGLESDTANGVAYYSPNYIGIGRAEQTGTLPITVERGGTFFGEDWGTAEHKFQFRLRQNDGTNSGNEINNGIVEAYVDGRLLGKAVNVFNRNPANAFIESVGFFGYSRNADQAWSILLRDITISENGWVD